jgi:hypothetical protein
VAGDSRTERDCAESQSQQLRRPGRVEKFGATLRRRRTDSHRSVFPPSQAHERESVTRSSFASQNTVEEN